jgi:myo-inositol-1(or 4)-monophosphatase
MELKDYKDFAIEVARGAGEILMKHYGKLQESDQDWKTQQHFKTIADDESDKYIRDRIKTEFPEHNIYSEEGKDLHRGSEYSWIIDPLDGTIPFRFGDSDHFSVCIALAREENPIVGVVYVPKREELYVGVKGQGAFCNSVKISPSLENNVNRVIMGLDYGKETSKFKRSNLAPYIEKIYSPDGIAYAMCSGCASVSLVLTASGKRHAYMALSLEPWDMAAAVVINREAGNRVTNLSGEDWDLDDESILVANPELHPKLVELLNLSKKLTTP